MLLTVFHLVETLWSLAELPCTDSDEEVVFLLNTSLPWNIWAGVELHVCQSFSCTSLQVLEGKKNGLPLVKTLVPTFLND